MPSPANSLAAAYLVIYILLLPFNIYNLIRHGRHGLLGWLYLVLFAALRIIGAGLQLSDSSSKTAALINGVGLSPLTLAVLGVLHESSHYIRSLCSSNETKNTTTAGGNDSGYTGEKTGDVFVLSALPYVIVHLAVGGAFALVIIGARKTPPDLGKERAGYFVFVVVWAVLVFFAVLAWMWRGVRGGRDARVLLYAIALVLPFLFIRIVYALAASFDSSINAETGPIAYRVVLQALMEFVIAIGLVVAGVVTRDICKNARVAAMPMGGVGGMPLPQRGGYSGGVMSGVV